MRATRNLGLALLGVWLLLSGLLHFVPLLIPGLGHLLALLALLAGILILAGR
jgi:hypothetical protein